MARTNSEKQSPSKSHAERQQGEEKIHGDALDTAVSSASEHEAKSSGARQSAIPAPDDGGHVRSQAAHLGGHAHDHTKPVGDLRKYEAEREPPQLIERVGKEHRRQ